MVRSLISCLAIDPTLLAVPRCFPSRCFQCVHGEGLLSLLFVVRLSAVLASAHCGSSKASVMSGWKLSQRRTDPMDQSFTRLKDTLRVPHPEKVPSSWQILCFDEVTMFLEGVVLCACFSSLFSWSTLTLKYPSWQST